MHIYFKKIIKLTFITLTLGFLFSLSTLWYFSTDLPDYKILANYKPPISSRVHSGEGQLIAEYALQKRIFIPYDSVPKNVIYSFLSAEDKNFFFSPRSRCEKHYKGNNQKFEEYLFRKKIGGSVNYYTTGCKELSINK